MWKTQQQKQSIAILMPKLPLRVILNCPNLNSPIKRGSSPVVFQSNDRSDYDLTVVPTSSSLHKDQGTSIKDAHIHINTKWIHAGTQTYTPRAFLS